jgi:hypothetical protein
MDEKQIGPRVEFAYSQWCVFCDRGTGEVMHIHEYLMSRPEHEVPQEELEEQARRAAGERLRGERIRVIHPPKDMRLDPAAIYAVDLQKGTVAVAGRAPLGEWVHKARGAAEKHKS